MTTESDRDINSDAELDRLQRLATLLDASFRVPFTGFRIGLDALIGLIPGIGDVASVLISFTILYRGWCLGASKSALLRMLWNLFVDTSIGAIPLAGDLFDAAWKANLRNIDLLRKDLANNKR